MSSASYFMNVSKSENNEKQGSALSVHFYIRTWSNEDHVWPTSSIIKPFTFTTQHSIQRHGFCLSRSARKSSCAHHAVLGKLEAKIQTKTHFSKRFFCWPCMSLFKSLVKKKGRGWVIFIWKSLLRNDKGHFSVFWKGNFPKIILKPSKCVGNISKDGAHL